MIPLAVRLLVTLLGAGMLVGSFFVRSSVDRGLQIRHDTPPALDVIAPVPLPLETTVSVRMICANSAFAEVLAERTSVQVVDDPEHAPPHRPKVELFNGEAVNVTIVPAGNVPMQVAPQLTPAGTDVTSPVPVPDFVSVNVTMPGESGGASIGRASARHTPAEHSSPGGHRSSGPHVIAPSSNFGEKHAPSVIRTTHKHRCMYREVYHRW